MIVSTVCLHLYGIPTPVVLDVKQKLQQQVSRLEHLTVHLHEISDYRSIVAANLSSVPTVNIPQTQSSYSLAKDEQVETYVSRVCAGLIHVAPNKGASYMTCGLCDASCQVIWPLSQPPS